ncbi:MAG: fumarate hydratase [Peptococcaceae bacterium BRH_c4a]|nr:MAG: fumarate hydratase [Peptococcaceae bacterium BRH_c4a]
MSQIKLTTPLYSSIVEKLRIGQRALLSGIIYTAEEEAHKKMVESLRKNEKLPFPIAYQVLFYVSFSPVKPGHMCGSAGPSNGEKFDPYTPLLIDHGVKGMIGKGSRSPEVINALKKHKAVYFAAVGGASALIASSVKSCRVIAYPELGDEAVCELVVKDLPVIVVNDVLGGDLYAESAKIYTSK